MKNVKTRHELEKNIIDVFDIDSSFAGLKSHHKLRNDFIQLLPFYLLESIKDISIENNYLLELMDAFYPEYEWDYSMDNFLEFKQLNNQQLAVVKEFLLFISLHQIDLFDQHIVRGLYVVEWHSKINDIYNSLEKEFSSNIVIKREDVLSRYYEHDQNDEEGAWYIRELLAGKTWTNIPKESVIDIFTTMDYSYVSEKTICFLVPLVILYYDELDFSRFFFTYESILEVFDSLNHSQANLVARFLTLRYEIHDPENKKELAKAMENYWNKFL